MIWTRDAVEAAGRNGRQVVLGNPEGIRCRVLDRFWLVADPDDQGFTPNIRQDGFWESWITAWMMNQLQEHKAVIDVGANAGYYTLLALSMGSSVLAFEPQPDLHKRVVSGVYLNRWAWFGRALNQAVGARQDTLKLMVPKHHGMNASVAIRGYSPTGEYDEYDVPVVPLDDFRHWEPNLPVLIKVDAEGAEPQVWAGMQQFWRTRLVTLLLEFRWDRYVEPMEFARSLFAGNLVSFVDFQGEEMPLHDPVQLQHKPADEDWMLVIRQR